MSALVSISRSTMRLNFIVFYSQATFWTLFLRLLRLVRIFSVTRTGVVCHLQLVYEVKTVDAKQSSSFLPAVSAVPSVPANLVWQTHPCYMFITVIC